jgi:hypothetical protein
MQSCRDHLGVVDDEGIPGIEQIRQVSHMAVREHSLPARVDYEEPAGISRRNRAQGDALVRELEIECIRPHCPS